MPNRPAIHRLSRARQLRSLLVHLRLHFQILLSPIFLWGFYLAGGTPDVRFWTAFLSLHVFLYGGATAFNSFYDRDEGPVGGLATPPPVTPELLPFSLIMQATGVLLAAAVGVAFLALYLATFMLFAAYSHPSTRLKGRPVAGLVAVALGQGLIAGLCGVAAAGSLAALSTLDWLGLLGAAGMTTGFYPITQLYQVREDLARGDVTFAAWRGARGTFRFALGLMGLSALLLSAVFLVMFGPGLAALLSPFCAGLLGTLWRWSHRYDPEAILANYRQVMRLHRVMSLGFLAMLLVLIFA